MARAAVSPSRAGSSTGGGPSSRLVQLSPENADGWNMYAFLMCYEQARRHDYARTMSGASRWRHGPRFEHNRWSCASPMDGPVLFDDTASLQAHAPPVHAAGLGCPRTACGCNGGAATMLGDTATARRPRTERQHGVHQPRPVSLGPVWDHGGLLSCTKAEDSGTSRSGACSGRWHCSRRQEASEQRGMDAI